MLPLARCLARFGWELWASEGTAAALTEAGLAVRRLAELTGMTSLLGGRLKTLHPRVFAGVLARGTPQDQEELARLETVPFDLVVVEFYPFEQAVQEGGRSWEQLVELIDVGGPALVRAAAKNHERVAVVCQRGQYQSVIEHLERTGGQLPDATMRRRLAEEAFRRTALYDQAVARALAGSSGEGLRFPERLELGGFRFWRRVRYGENPHQQAAVYRTEQPVPSVVWGQMLQGKELSYNNIADACAAWELALELAEQPAAVAIKHATPCGAAVAESLVLAYEKAYEADPVSIFGGVVALTRPVDRATAQAMARTFLEVVVAPEFTPEAREVFAQKPNVRLVEVGSVQPPGEGLQLRSIPGGLLVQTEDRVDLDPSRLRTVTKVAVAERLWPDLRFAWRVAKHARSNAIVVAREGQTVGIGAGQVSRIDAARQALQKAGEKARGAVLASDGFFPFADVVELAAQYGIAAIIQPGGSIRDHESITAADRAGIAMVFTGIRHFRH
ncbi:MAG TPA: bifunctional phosphoribosylaminoimidazolecarboxamide formyltransferase/IMP cyclohydrolase [Limnochordales bacterium]